MENELELVQQAKAGDLRSFEALVKLHSHKAYHCAYRILHNKTLSEDCVQEVFLKVYKGLGSFDEKSKFSTWLHSVTVFTAIDIQRKQSRQMQNESDVFEDVHGCDANSPQQHHAQQSLSEITQNAMSQLSEDLRVAFMLRHYQGCSIKEISQMLKVNDNTIKNRIFRAVGQLKQLLKQKVGDYETVD